MFMKYSLRLSTHRIPLYKINDNGREYILFDNFYKGLNRQLKLIMWLYFPKVWFIPHVQVQ